MGHIKDMLDKKWIEKCEPQEWSSRIALIPKKNGKKRFIINLAAVTQRTKKLAQEGFTIDEVCNEVSQWPVRMELDITQSYHQFPLHPKDRPLTAFIAPDNQTYRYRVLPMGWGPSSTLHNAYLRTLINPLIHTPKMLLIAYADNLFVGLMRLSRVQIHTPLTGQGFFDLFFKMAFS
eukprot:GHVN01049101.1.p2 GENE.GHVN01049101.1~~GHVN01049101.1.p2  ORF type:complete len:177 (+),score=27.12 GHVN01049101.1:1869-2399(+)